MGANLKAEFIEPFLQASIHVLETMANLTPTPGKPELKVDDQAKGDITGIIGFTGPAEGSMSITFSEACFSPIRVRAYSGIGSFGLS
jgi:chemotaxis protein CheX